jgi:hypothetical protein
MANYAVIFHQRIDDYAVVQTLTEPDIDIGVSFVLAGLGHSLNGSGTVYALPQYLFVGVNTAGDPLYDTSVPIPNQVLFYNVGDTLERSAAIPQGQLQYTETCTWVLGPAVGTWLGIDLAGVDETAFLQQCASASSNFMFQRRQEAGYTDSLITSPSTNVTLATTMYAGALYRQRGSVDQFASFDGMGNVPTTGLSPIIKQLAGIPRPAVA